MKKTLKVLLAMALVLCMMPLAALADDADTAPEIGIQLNGEMLTFKSGVAPYFDSETNRNFVPFRDLFEAMGAEVDYDADTRIITATRDDTVVTFSQDGYELTVVSGGVTTTVTSDVKPITRDGRTLVPIRFASQALGAQVGWDQANKTVIVVEAPALAEAFEGEFTLLEKLNELGTLEAGKNAAVDMTMAFNMEMDDPDMGKVALPIEATYSGIQDMEALVVDASMTLKMDLTALLGAAMPGMDGNMNINAEIIANVGSGDFYIKSAELAAMLGTPEGTWIRYNLYETAGVELPADLLETAAELSTEDLFNMLLAEAEFTSVDDYAELKSSIQGIVALFADESFVKNGNKYTNTIDLNAIPGLGDLGLDKGSMIIEIEVDANDNVVAVNVSFEVVQGSEWAVITVKQTADGMTIDMTLEAEGMSMTLAVEGTIEATDEAPRSAPPAGDMITELLEPTGDVPGDETPAA